MLNKVAGEDTAVSMNGTRCANAPRRVLIVLHQERSTPGRIGNWLRAAGFELDIRRPPLGDDLPDTLDAHYGAVIFGGPMSANDPDDYIKREIDWINVPLAEDKPFIGVCLGAQMMVKTLGGEVSEHPEGHVEIGYYPITPTQAGKALIDWPEHVYQWHREGATLPGDATLLATSEHFENQAFVYGRKAYGIQFHSELTLAMMHRWTIHGRHRFELRGAQHRDLHFAGRLRHDPPLRAWLDRFMTHWTSLEPVDAPTA